jgi:alkaline phosphatase D
MTNDDGLSRRHFLGLVAAAAAAGLAAGCSDDDEGKGEPEPSEPPGVPPAPPAADLSGDPFTLGVTSGDPAPDSVVLWTRLAPDGGPPSGDVVVQWEVSADDAFTSLVAVGVQPATAADNFSIHAVAGGLAPATAYKYRFRVGDFTSPTGTTRTLPEVGATVEDLRFAFASCQDYQAGYYTAYPHLVADQPDLVVFLGDFVYEDAADPKGVRQHTGEALRSLDDYRDRYALYLKDSGLRAARAVAPWIVIWDDHEVANDYASGVAVSGSGDEFAQRRANAYKAWWENQPVRMAAPTGPALDINRSFAFGSLLSVVCLDGRQFRATQVCETDQTRQFPSLVPPCPDLELIDREMLGTAQNAWVQDELTRSEARWNVLANQTIMSDLKANVAGRDYVQVDQWDGYPAARSRLLQAIKASGATNPVVITGDIHATVVGSVFEATEAIASELVGPSLTSSFPDALVDGVDLRSAFNSLPIIKPNLVFCESSRHGYVVVDVTADRMTAQYRMVDGVDQPSSTVSTMATFDIAPGKVGPVKRA